MRNNMLKKGLLIGIIVLFIGSNLVSGFNIQLKNTTIPLITGRGYIQDLIDNASDGDTIYIPSGIYYENIIIYKSISLVGEDKDTTIIDGSGSGDVVTINADEVTVSDFTIQNSGNDSWDDAGVQINSNRSKIIGNFIVNCSPGVFITPKDEWDYSITYGNIIAENNIKNNEGGLIVVESEDTKIYDNNLINNGLGILDMPLHLPVKNDYQCQVFRYYNNEIYRNNITNNTEGIYLLSTYCAEVYENQITDNKNGITLKGWYGSGGSNNIYQNNITMNDRGVYMCSLAGGSNSNNIYQNNITNNNEGIFMDGDGASYGAANNNNIFQNNIMFNIRGIYITCQFLSNGGRNNNIYHNNFIDNTENAYDKGNNIWDNGSVGNYWDDYKGKNELPPYGIGDTPYNIPPRILLNKDRFPLMKPWPYNKQTSQSSQQSSSLPSSIISGVTLSSQKQLGSRESENNEKLQFWYLIVHVKEIYGTVDEPQYRPLTNVTVEVNCSLFCIFWEFFWSGTTDESGEAVIDIVNSIQYKVTISKDGYHTYRCSSSKIVWGTWWGQFEYHVNFTMAENGSPFVKQISQSSQQKNHITLECDIL